MRSYKLWDLQIIGQIGNGTLRKLSASRLWGFYRPPLYLGANLQKDNNRAILALPYDGSLL